MVRTIGIVRAKARIGRSDIASDGHGLVRIRRAEVTQVAAIENPPASVLAFQPFDHPAVESAAIAVDRGLSVVMLQRLRPFGFGKLAPLVGVAGFRLAVSRARFLQDLDPPPVLHAI
jgi:hypothetical protein